MKRNMTCSEAIIFFFFYESPVFLWAHYEKEITVRHRKINTQCESHRTEGLYSSVLTEAHYSIVTPVFMAILERYVFLKCKTVCLT